MAATSHDGERDARIKSVLREVVRQRQAGDGPDDAEVERQHPELMPELRERLQALRDIQAAALAAEEREPIELDTTRIDEDVRFLKEALPAYDILERMDYGGQGVVYKAIQRSTQRLVAIKVLLDGPLASQRQRQRLAREAELISRLDHPNVVTLYEYDFVRGRPFFAMEFVDGLPIDDYALLHSLSVVNIVRLFVTVCGAVSHAHQQGIIHRDLNPSNILVSLEGDPHVLDFGLAKDAWSSDAGDPHTQLTMSGQVLGTLPYLSPEQAGGGDGRVDVRSDVYSLGVVLFELLTGEFPYPVDGSPADARANIIGRDPASLRKALPEERLAETSGALVGDLEVILRKALAKEKERRYQSVAALADDLQRSLAGDPVEARSGSRLYLLQRTIRKYRVAAAVAAVILLMATAWAVSASMLWIEARQQRDTARKTANSAFETLKNLMDEVDETISRLAGGSEARDRIFRDVVERQLEELRPLVESDDALKPLTGGLYEKLGDIAYLGGNENEPARYYERSIAIRRELEETAKGTVENRLDLARTLRKYGRVAANREALFKEAVSIGRAVANEEPGDEQVAHELCVSLIEFARYSYRERQFTRAADLIKETLSIAVSMRESTGANERWDTLLADAYAWDGETQLRFGNGSHGIKSLRDSLAIREALFNEHPADATRRYKVLNARLSLGGALADDSQFSEARATVAKAVAAGEFLMLMDPKVADWCIGLFNAYYQLAQLDAKDGDIPAARENAEAAFKLSGRLLEREPQSTEWKDTRAYAYSIRGQVALGAEELDEAARDFADELAIREALCADNSDDAALRTNLEVAETFSGYCARLRGDAKAALEHYKKAHAITTALLADQPDVTDQELNFIRTATNLAIGHLLFEGSEHVRAAERLLEDATTRLEALRVNGKLVGYARNYIATKTELQKAAQSLAEHIAQERSAASSASSGEERASNAAREP